MTATSHVEQRSSAGRRASSLAGGLIWKTTRLAIDDPLGFAMILLSVAFVLVAVLADVLVPHDPLEVNLANAMLPPLSPDHPLGTDQLGRDLLSRLIAGTRVSIAMAVTPVAIAGCLGAVLGMLSGWYRGPLDTVLMRVAEIFMCVPSLVLALVVSAMLGPSVRTMIIALTIPAIPDIMRMIRQQTIVVASTPYVEGVQAVGAGTGRILLRYILPNVMPVLLVLLTLRLASMVFAATALSFLGVGIPLPQPDWGNITADGAKIIAFEPWQATLGGFVIFVCMLAFTMAAETLREAADPLFERTRRIR